jgi:hypothetical protein
MIELFFDLLPYACMLLGAGMLVWFCLRMVCAAWVPFLERLGRLF